MDAQGAKAEAEGQRPSLLGWRCRHRLRREGLSFFGTTVVWALAGWALHVSSIKPAFYSAAAAIVPVLLLALLLRFGQAREQIAEIGASVDQTEEMKRKVAAEFARKVDPAKQGLSEIEAELNELEAKDPHDGEVATQELRAKIQDHKDAIAAVRAEIDKCLGPDPYFSGIRLHRLSEEDFAGLLLGLAVGLIALYAILIALATGHSRIIGFAVTANGMNWLLLEIARLEVSGFATRAWANKPSD